MFKLLFYSSLLYICVVVAACMGVLIIGMILYQMPIPDGVMLLFVGAGIGGCVSYLEIV